MHRRALAQQRVAAPPSVAGAGCGGPGRCGWASRCSHAPPRQPEDPRRSVYGGSRNSEFTAQSAVKAILIYSTILC